MQTLAFLLILTFHIQSQWINQNPVQEYEDLKKIDFIDQNTGWIVGNLGVVLFTTNAGANWEYRNTPNVNLSFVDFVNANTGYVSTQDGMMFRTTNGGVNWSQLNMAGNTQIFSYYFADANTGIATAGNNLIKTTNGGTNWNTILTGSGRYFVYAFFLNASTGFVSSFNGEILKTTNFGNNWTSNSAPYGKLFFANENTGWVYQGNDFVNTLNKTTNGGLSWFVQNHPMPRLSSIDFLNTNTGYGAGGSNIMTTTNGGQNWQQYPAYNYSADIKSLGTNSAIITGGRNFIAKTSNSGLNWNNISKKIGTNIGVKFFDANTGYISGEAGIFAKSTDGGTSWTKIQTGTLENLGLYFLNLNTGWLLTNKQKVFKTTNAGITWDITSLNITKSLFNIYFSDLNNGWICGDSGTILVTSNGGSNWSLSNTGVYARIFKTIQFNNQNLAAISLDSTILVSTNAGNSWIINNFPQNGFADISITDNTSAYAFGYSSIVKTTNSGLNWSVVNNDLPISGFKFVNFVGNTFYAVTSMSVYKSVNGGVNWSYSQVSSLPYTCFSISFIDVNTGWVAGESGVLFKNTNCSAIGIETISAGIPVSFLLYQNYPNPFNPETKIKFDLPEDSFIKFVIYDITGKEIATLLNEELEKGSYSVNWNASGLPSGIYFYRIISGKFTDSRKMILIK